MLSTCILSKSVIGQVTSPYKWLKIAVRLNSRSSSSSSSSSDSSSDSDSDLDSNIKQKQEQKGIKKDETRTQNSNESELLDILQDMLNKTSTSENIGVTMPIKRKTPETIKQMPFEKQLASAAGSIFGENLKSKMQSEDNVIRGSPWNRERTEDSIIMKLAKKKSRNEDDATRRGSQEKIESRQDSIIVKLAKERAQSQNDFKQHQSRNRRSTESRRSTIAELAREFENDLVQRLVPPKNRTNERQTAYHIVDKKAQDSTRIEPWERKRSLARSLMREHNAESGYRTTQEHSNDRSFSKPLDKGTETPLFRNIRQRATNIPQLETWNMLQEKELKLFLKHYPLNGFQEMIQWTEEGKLWKFPIDNEQGMEQEHEVHFSRHVFTENYIKDWCPKRGPIRHFMELVCVGLSKNPYMTVDEKIEHIMWYKQYFEDKKELLLELGAVEITDFPDKPAQIEAK